MGRGGWRSGALDDFAAPSVRRMRLEEWLVCRLRFVVAVFWPAMGFGVGVLIGLGPSARWPVLAAITVANFLANLSSGDPPQIAAATCLSEATECLVPALLVERWFGPEFNLTRLRHVLGLLAAAAFGSAVGSVCRIVASRLFYGQTGPILTTFQHWFLSDMIGFITLGPFVLGLFAAWRQPPPQREIMEGLIALLALAMVTGTIILLPSWLWETALPITWLFPMLLWLAARCRPIFAAAAAFSTVDRQPKPAGSVEYDP